jgi:hypothetical protein
MVGLAWASKEIDGLAGDRAVKEEKAERALAEFNKKNTDILSGC